MRAWRTTLSMAALVVVAGMVPFSGADAVIGGTPSTTVLAPAPLNNQGLQRLALLERESALFTAEAALSGAEVGPFIKSLPGLEKQLRLMRQKASALTSEVVVAKKQAVHAIINEFVTGSTSQSAGMFTGFNTTTQSQASSIYQGLAVAANERAISSYLSLSKRTNALVSEIEAHVQVIVSTIPNLSLTVRTLTKAAKSASSAAAKLSTARAARLSPSITKALNIEGPSTLTAAEMAGWWKSMGYTNDTGVSILNLAREYIKAGNAEGVAGDVAFAQSILETGGFAIMSGSNNFAGIGACNSCNGGYNYSSYVQGIRAQVQLLHAYADKKLTSAKLVGGAAYHGIDTLSVRGCCISWPKLSAVWASGTHYGTIILGIYTKMLQWAVLHIGPHA